MFIAIAQTIDNHQNAIVNLAAHIERVEMRLDEMRDQLRYVSFSPRNGSRPAFLVLRVEGGKGQAADLVLPPPSLLPQIRMLTRAAHSTNAISTRCATCSTWRARNRGYR